jgi:hypothetical protein
MATKEFDIRMKQEIIKCVHTRLYETMPLRETNLWESIKRMIPCPMPATAIERKYVYFYNPYSYEINTEKYMTYLDNSYNLNELRRTDENPGWDKIRCFLKDADEKVFLFAIN